MTVTARNTARRRFAFAVVLILSVVAGWQQGRAQLGNLDTSTKPKAYVVYAAEPQTVPVGKRGVLELRFQVVEPFHVNSHTPKSQLLIPTTLTLSPVAGVKAGMLEYPAGKPYSFAFDPGDKLDIYAGNFTVKLPVVATAGEHTVEATLRYQACDNASCYPPKLLPVKILFTAK